MGQILSSNLDGRIEVGTCKKSNVNYGNHCDEAVGDEYEAEGFCSPVTDDNERKKYCGNIGDGEWEFSGRGESCYYNSSNNHQRVSGDCPGAIAGQSTRCRRKEFKGDPQICCLRDLSCNKQDEFCYQTKDGMKTCDPRYRDMASSSCKEIMYNYCTGKDTDRSEVWINRWLGDVNIGGEVYNRPCYNLLYRELYNGQPAGCSHIVGGGVIENGGYIYDQDLLNGMISRYIQDGGDLSGGESTEGNIKLNTMIWSICNQTPGLCQKALYNYCANITGETILRNSNLLPWCGCYMPGEQYEKYTSLYQLTRECTPICNMSATLKPSTADGSHFLTCKQSICIIDDISINIAKSQVGNVSFTQLCNSCGEGTCNCIINNGNFDIVNSKTGNISVSQQCSGTSSCYRPETQPDGTVKNVKIPCVGDSPVDEVVKKDKENYDKAVKQRNIYILIIFLILICLIIITWWILSATKVISSNRNNTTRFLT
jgi:hypothetical protein